MEIQKEKYSITELSQILHVTDHALRYYEKEFKLNIPKDDRGRRFYNAEYANIMYQIKLMRDEGLEIKAIRKILQNENIIKEPDYVEEHTAAVSIVPAVTTQNVNLYGMEAFFNEFREQLASDISVEINTSREQLSREITKSKLELGACVENGMRKMEAKMDRHFEDVDKALGNWRNKNKKGLFKFL